jgi:peptide-methionine (S)-S-oxide reductase
MSLFGSTGHTAAAAEADLPKPNIDLPTPTSGGDQTVVFAGGCFWCTEGAIEQVVGVKDVISGYAGGTKETANYEAVCSGRTGHAEAIRITYDPAKISYGTLLQIFFTAHDPTTKDRQGNDRGPQYRSAIFFQSEDEKKVAEAYIKQLNDAKVFGNPVVTTLEPLKADGFYVAEKYHQDYASLNPTQPYICNVADPKIQKVKKHFPNLIKKDEKK